MSEQLEKLRFPVGHFQYQSGDFEKNKNVWLETIAQFPAKISELANSMTEEELDSQYRPEGWTARQVIHHVVDSHMNSYIRFKWTLTENEPMIKAYEEKFWAELPEAKTAPVEISLNLLAALHARWSLMLNAMTEEDWSRKLNHPDWEKPLNLKLMLGLYAWHCRHHLEHVRLCKN